MERISIFNYEAFYLDYLEGNLSQEDNALFLAFLSQHPELKMDEEEIDFLLPIEEVSLTTNFKAGLKAIDFLKAEINLYF